MSKDKEESVPLYDGFSVEEQMAIELFYDLWKKDIEKND